MEITSSTPQEREKYPSPTTPPPPPTPTPISRSQDNNNPYPTTFVQADTSSFKQVVQMLTGSSKSGGGAAIPPVKSTGNKRQGHKLYERRNSLKNGLMINTMAPGFLTSRKHEILSPSILDFPSLVLSPVTPMIEEEEKAIAEKKFYFHPSPRRTKDAVEPQLLPLFPVTSPRV